MYTHECHFLFDNLHEGAVEHDSVHKHYGLWTNYRLA